MDRFEDQLAKLTPQQRAVLELKLKKKRAATGVGQKITRRQETDAHPMSFSQQRLWFIDQLQPGESAYNIGYAARIQGDLNVDALEKSVQEILRRHEVLRSYYLSEAGKPIQKIMPADRFVLSRIDLAHIASPERPQEARRLATTEVHRAFDLSEGPMLRVTLMRLDPTDHLLVVVFHHIASDGWSNGLFLNELSALYDAFSQNQRSPLEELQIEYADYAAWQRQWLTDDVLEHQLNYWRKKLDRLSVLELPTDRPRPAMQSMKGARLSILLAPLLNEQLQALGRQQGATPFMTLLAAFKVLLLRYSGQDDITLGTPIAGRNRRELEPLIGFFANTLALRTDLSGDPTFLELLSRIQETALGAFAHQELPFDKLVEELEPERSLSHAPLVQVLFAYQNVPPQSFHPSRLKLQPFDLGRQTAKFDLSLLINETSQGLLASIEYATDLFGAPTIEQMLESLQVLLEAVVSDPNQPISTLPILTESKREQLLAQWTDTKRDYPNDQCVHQLFERQAATRPNAVALEMGTQQMTYGQLNSKANQLAHQLRAMGVGPDVLVGICVPRSFDLIVGLLGILKAGGAYVPLDADYPHERLAYMIQDTAAPILITTESMLERLTSINDLEQPPQWVCLDRDQAGLAANPSENLSHDTGPDHLVYVTYTSGSTGMPKGVLVRHRGVLRLLFGTTFADFGPDQTFLQLAPVSFDASTLEIWGALLHGGRLVLYRDRVPNIDELGQTLKDHGVTSLWLTATLYNAVIDQAPDALAGLHQLLIGGEALSVTHVRRGLQALGDTQIINGYGPTESTTFTCCYRIPQCLAKDAGSIPIGRPIGNTTVYILDAHMNPVPIGVPGQLYIGGDGLARGYLNDPALTVEKFVHNPFHSIHPDAGEKLYKTGDLVRYLPPQDQDLADTPTLIEFLGRLDDQVKIRGFRIELGEIETALAQHRDLREAVVLARQDAAPGGEKRLVAYVVPQAGSEANVEQVRAFLRQRLPDHMIPSSFVVLDAIPKTPNGKADRKALPAPDQSRDLLQEAYVAPNGPVQEILADLWSQLLGVDRVGAGDNFFNLGGHSLLATVLISRVRDAFDVHIPLRSLFEAPTIADLANRIESARHQDEHLTSPAITPVSRQGDLPLSPAQKRLWFLSRFGSDQGQYHISTMLRLVGALNVEALNKSLSQVVDRHETLRTTFSIVDQNPVQVVSQEMNLRFKRVDLRSLPPAERESELTRLIADQRRTAIDLSIGPLLRTALIQLSDDEHVLIVTMPHIISDGWSIGVFWRELDSLYTAFASGQSSPLGKLPIQYGDYAHWQNRCLEGEGSKPLLAYWENKLAGVATLQLPTDRPRPAVQTFHGDRQTLVLPAALSEGLKRLSQEQGATLFMTLLAGFKALLSRYAGQTDIVLGTPVSGRTRSELEGLIGFFINTLVLRTDLSNSPNFHDLLGRVKETVLDAFDHQQLPFDQLVGHLHPQRDLSRNPIFQVQFAMVNLSDQAPKFGDLKLKPQGQQTEMTRFDLELDVVDRPDGLLAICTYNTDLFDAATIQRLLAHYQILLEAALADPKRQIDQLPLISEEERDQLLVEWNPCQTQPLEERCLHEWFAKQASVTPDAVALCFEDRQLTYQELDTQANRLAHRLQKLGVGPGVLTAICVERSLDLIVGILGILKAGGAYVPLDPSYPTKRLAFMVQDTQSPVLVTQEHLLDVLPKTDAAQSFAVLCLDRDQTSISTESSSEPVSGTAPADTAYVIYTSGSTGKPKGVMVSHANATRLFLATDAWYQFHGDDVWTLFHSYAFDFSVWEIWGALLYGGRLVVVPYETSRSPQAFYKLLIDQQVSVLNQTPSAFRQLITAEAAMGTDDKLNLRYVIFGGEALEPKSLAPWFERHGDQKPQLVNMYGITETTVHVTYRPLSKVDIEQNRGSMIGQPIPDLRVYILDAHRQPVPIGVPGELYVGGSGVATGYLNRDELTKERFIDDPFSEQPGRKIYKTGDLARYTVNGDIEYLSRIDDQVKIRGFRIELGEIEAALGDHPVIRETVVLARDEASGEKRLIAYLVVEGAVEPSVTELRHFLSDKLPSYMVPAAFVILDQFPLTDNGKIDRQVLPAPDAQRPALEDAYVGPRNEREQRLAQIWIEVLGVEQVGVHDNFFELGGDSIQSILIISRANEAGLGLTPKDLFQHQTIAELALIATDKKRVEAEQGPVSGCFGLTPIQYWFFERELGDQNHFNQATMLETNPDHDASQIEQVVAHLFEHHDALRSRFIASDNGWQQEILDPRMALPFTHVDLSGLAEADQRRSVEETACKLQTSLNIESGPVVQVAFFKLGNGQPGRLLIIVHHLVVDGVSWRILLEDLQTAIQQLSQGQPVRFPAKTTSFLDWSKGLTAHASSPEMAQESEYWVKKATLAVVKLPIDHPEGLTNNTASTAAVDSASLTVEETQSLLTEVTRAYNTQINDVLLTALAQTCEAWVGGSNNNGPLEPGGNKGGEHTGDGQAAADYESSGSSGESDNHAPWLLVNMEGHGREQISEDLDVSRTVGWFTTIYPMFLDLRSIREPGQAIKSIKEQLRQIPNHGIGYGALRYLSTNSPIRQTLGSMPQAQISFNYLGQFDATLKQASDFRPARESYGPLRHTSAKRQQLLEINAIVLAGQLKVDWIYCRGIHDKETIENVAKQFMENLRNLIRHCCSLEAGGYTPSDFPLADVDQDALDAALAQVEFE